jgi:hypothetical protein
VELCLQRISLVLVSVPFDLYFSSSAVVVSLVRWFLGACLLQQALHRQDLSDSSEGGARTSVCFQFARVLVVVARLSKSLFAIFINFKFTYPTKGMYNAQRLRMGA